MTKRFEAQSRELDQKKRKKMVWEIDAKLQAKGVSGYELNIVTQDAELPPGVVVVGSCNGGQHKITYFRG